MSYKTIKLAICDALQDLNKNDLDAFCYCLRDRREEPRVKYRQVAGKSVYEITDLLVSTFTETGARKVTLEILRQINCNEEAKRLDLETKVCVDTGRPTFRKTSDGKLEKKPSQEALDHEARNIPLRGIGHGGNSTTAKKPEEVEAEAKSRVLSEGGDVGNSRLVLSRYEIQFGKYKGQTFKWLLENNVGYAVFIVAKHQEERESKRTISAAMLNMESLTRYVAVYPEVMEEVRFQQNYEKSKEGSLQPGQEGQALVGFGQYESETLQDLYESKDEKKVSYVNFLRARNLRCTPGSKMDIAVRYILKRDKELTAVASASSRSNTRCNSHTPRMRQTKCQCSSVPGANRSSRTASSRSTTRFYSYTHRKRQTKRKRSRATGATRSFCTKRRKLS